MSNGILLLRLALGMALVLQGTAKLSRRGRHDTAAFFDDVGIRPGLPFALLAGGTELGVGVLLIAGFATVLAGAGATAVLSIAATVTWRNGYWNAAGGSEYPILAGLAALALAFTGAGAHSIDEIIGWSTPSSVTTIAALVLAALVAAPMLLVRTRNLRQSARAVVPIPSHREAA
jgi:putative oxidoreductase